MRIKRALLSVSDKTGIVELAKFLNENGVEIISTGGTMKAIKEAGVPVTYVSDVTGFPEIMDGRVKTLNPKIHGAILAVRSNPEHVKAMEEHGIKGIDLVVVNLYPFKETISKPGVTEEEAIEKLWDAILHTVHITEDNDPVAVWKEHVDFLNSKSAWLNEQHFTSLRYKSANGTDFTVGLISGAKWASAGMTNSLNDKYFIPNMPTEEVFTSPKAGKAEGTLVSTKALSWNGQLINNFSITFENGKAVSCKAEEGQELLEMMIHMDETSCMLGEVALVPKTSPVNLCGFLFYNTLFDENAVCHCALGMGFKEVLPDGDNITMAEAVEKYGINDSIIHVDFMVGSDDLEVVGIREDGSETQIFVNGNWA